MGKLQVQDCSPAMSRPTDDLTTPITALKTTSEFTTRAVECEESYARSCVGPVAVDINLSADI